MSTRSAGNSGNSGRTQHVTDTELELYALERYINEMWQSLPVPVACISPQGVIIDVSSSFLEMLRYRREELIGGTLLGLLGNGEKAGRVQDPVFCRERASKYECVIRSKSGQRIPVSVSALARRNEHGAVTGYYIALIDITDRVTRDGNPGSVSETEYRATLNSIGDGIHVVDRDLRFVMVNEALRARIREFGIDIDPLGKPLRDIFGFLPPEVEDEYSSVFKKGELLVTEERVTVAGREFISEVRKIPIFDGGTVKQVVTVVHDVTEQKRNEQIKTVLYQISAEVSTARDLQHSFEIIRRRLNAIIDTRNFAIALRNRGEPDISFVYYADEKAEGDPATSGRTLTSYVIEHGRPLLVTDNDARRMMRSGQIDTVEEPAGVWLGVPLRAKDEVIGALVVKSYDDPAAYSRRDLEVLEFVSEQVATALERKRVDKEMQQTIERLKKTSTGIIYTIAKILELRDPYTAGHQQRVARLACAIAREMGMSDEEVDGIFMAALIHDIGKIYVPAEILNRPAKLSDTEMDLVKTHPGIGYDIVKGIDFSQPVDRIVVQHHERIDGSGYPDGIEGDEIILPARILAVADVVEAMASHRPYRPAFSIDETLNEIEQCRDRLFDGGVVDACMKVFRIDNFKFE